MPIAKTTRIDVLLLVSVVVSVLISAVAASRILADQSFNMSTLQSQTNDYGSSLGPAKEQQGGSENMERVPGQSGSSGETSGLTGPAFDDTQLVPSYSPPQVNLASTLYSPIYSSAPYLLPITWGAVAGTLIWRGKVRSAWCKSGYDYETFKLVARMRGSPVRVRLLTSIATPKNRLQLANELDVDWKTIDNHMEILAKNGLVEEKTIVGTTRYYVLTEHGRRILLLLADAQAHEQYEQGTFFPNQQPPSGVLGT